MNNSEILRWSNLIALLVKRDLKVKYRGSILGYFWSLLNPILMMSVLTFVFSHVAKFEIENYPVFVLSGLIVWNLFSQSILPGTQAIVANAGLLRKVAVPGWVFPSATVATNLVNFFLTFTGFLGISVLTQHSVSLHALQAPVVILLLAGFTIGVILFLATLNVFFRDVGFLLDSAVQMLFYATPILYSPESVPEKFKLILKLNPVSWFIVSFRNAIYDHQLVPIQTWVLLCILTALSLLVGIKFYAKHRNALIYKL